MLTGRGRTGWEPRGLCGRFPFSPWLWESLRTEPGGVCATGGGGALRRHWVPNPAEQKLLEEKKDSV